MATGVKGRARRAERAEPARLRRVKGGMEAEDRAWRAGAWARTWAKKGARSEPVGKPYGFSGYLLENPTVLQGRRN